ncbi:MAG TPA: alkyl hydroperoxide reductase subunit F [Steroidobacteraceae bacterium]|nr:alkyl hydroperoxide reductase subunit F [Steroidobacteraceae bacterium]
MLDQDLKQQLHGYLGRITQPIEIIAALDDSDAARDMAALLQDIAPLSSLIEYRELRGADVAVGTRTPSFRITRAGKDVGVTFAGIPMGHEFTSLVLALLQAGGYPPKVDDAVIEQIKALDGDYDFEVFISLSCHNCPEVVQSLNLMAVLNPRVRVTTIDGALFQQEVERRQIMAVPYVFLNGGEFNQGRISLEELLAKVDSRAGERAAGQIDAKGAFDVLVVGGGPAGSSAAIYAARKGIRTGVVADRFGGQVMDTLGIENFISVKATEGPKLAAALEEHVKHYDVDIMNLQRAAKLVPAGADGLLTVELESGARLRSRTVIISTGARWRQMNVPGEKEYSGKGVAYCPHCDGPLFKGKRVAVIGGGNSGVEAAIDLAGIVAHVTLIEFDGRLRADEVLQRKLRSLPNVRVIVSAQTTEVQGADGKVNALSYKDRSTGEIRRLALEGVFVQIGLLPNTDWLKGTVALSPHGEIEVDASGQTSLPGVFAAGDATTVPYKQIIIAMGEGSKAALSAFDHLIRVPVPAAGEAAAA